MIEEKKKCIELIKSFIDERLDGDIQRFHDYDLDLLEKDEKYGAYDPDNSRIANAIYVVLWGDSLPNLTMDNLGGEWYRGDTMNSFNTLMGRPNENGTSFMGIQKYTNDPQIINMAKMYHSKYHTIGNLMVLPNKTLPSERTTLNQLRGGGAWYDYFDLFLSDIRNLMIGTNTDRIDSRLKSLVDINKHYFDNFQELTGFMQFCKTFYLESYVDLHSFEVHNIFSPYARHWPVRYSEEEYNSYVADYITKTTKIIDYRCSCMLENLEEVLNYDSDSKVSSKVEKSQFDNQSANLRMPTKTNTTNQSSLDIDFIKRYLKNVIKLESEKIIAEKTFDELAIEQKDWEQKTRYTPVKKKANISLLDMIITGAKTFGTVSIISIISCFVFDKVPLNLFFNILLFLALIISLFILPFALPIYQKIKDIHQINNDYKQQTEYKHFIENQGNNAISIITHNQEKLRETYRVLNNNLDKIYSAGIIYKKYHTLEACSAILEYLDSGRCYELEGPYGAYNKFDVEATSGIIISELQQIRVKLDIIIENQFELQSTVRHIAKSVSDMTKDIKTLCSSVSNTENNIAGIAENTKISAWSSAILATQVPDWQSEAIKKANRL